MIDVRKQRTSEIEAAIEDVRQILAPGVTGESLAEAKSRMVRLASRTALFPRSDFPLPEDGKVDRLFRLRQDSNGSFALYVNSGVSGQTTRPHDHGGSWAIIVGVEGREEHRLYRRTDSGDGPPGVGAVEVVEVVEVAPGNGVAMGPDGIHSIHANSPDPLMHLHLYGDSFEQQLARKEYNTDTGTYDAFQIGDYGFIEDAP